MNTELTKVDSTGSLSEISLHNPLENSQSSERNDRLSWVNPQALMRRNVGINWYVRTLQDIITGGWNWVGRSSLGAPRVELVRANVNELTARVSQVAGKYITTIRSAVNPAEFFPLLNRTQLQEVFPFSGDRQPQTYEANLLKYREMITVGNLNHAKKDTAVRIFRGLGLAPADRILRPYLPDASETPLSSLFKADRDAIRKVTPEIGQGWMSWGLAKVLGTVRLFDPIKDGNFPFLIGTRTIEGKEVNVLRHPIPTVEFGTIQIAPEYKAFLEYLKEQKTSILYDSLLQLPGQVSITSEARIDLLYDLGKTYPDVFHFIRMPFDDPLSKVDKYPTLDYRDCIRTELHNAVNNPGSSSNEFVFGSKKILDIVDTYYENIVEFAYNQILKVYPGTSEETVEAEMILLPKEKEKNQVLMMLVQTLLRSVLIKELGVGYYNNTCKHASDRASAATGCDLILSHLLTDTLKEHSMDLRLTAAWPAFMAKSSAVEEERAEWLDSFARFAETAIAQNKREQLVAAYKKAGFPIEEEMSYYRPEIYYPQVAAEIRKSIAGQDASREFSLDIPFGAERDNKNLVLEKLLEAFENQYSLSFMRVGEEELKSGTSEKEAHNLATGCFVVCDTYGDTYGELRFSIEFPSSDLQSDVLHATIKSNLQAVDVWTDEANVSIGNELKI